MPELPSGLKLALSRDAIIKHDNNWFKCPAGHFWYWTPAPEAGPAPYDLGATIDQVMHHAKAPNTRDEVKHFIRVLELSENGNYGWRGEWLASFPKFQSLNPADTAAWKLWTVRTETDTFLDETIVQCYKMAEVASNAVGYLITRPEPDIQPRSDGEIAVVAVTPHQK